MLKRSDVLRDTYKMLRILKEIKVSIKIIENYLKSVKNELRNKSLPNSMAELMKTSKRWRNLSSEKDIEDFFVIMMIELAGAKYELINVSRHMGEKLV